MSYQFLPVLLIVLLFSACAGQQEPAQQEPDYEKLLADVRQDIQHAFLHTLKPSLEDCQALFNGEENAQKAFRYVQQMYGVIDQLPEDSMKPVSADATAQMLSCTKADLLNGISNGLPEEFFAMAPLLNDGVSVYGLRYLNATGEEEKLRTAFFRVGEKWVFIPRPFKAFQ